MRSVGWEGPRPLPGREDLLVLQLLHPGGGGHRHGDHDVVDVEGALAAAPLDGLLLAHKTSVWFTSEASNTTDKKEKRRIESLHVGCSGPAYRRAGDALAGRAQRSGALRRGGQLAAEGAVK